MARLAAKQDGIVTGEQLKNLGLTSTAIRGWIRAGHLHRRHRGVYSVGHERLSELGHLTGALLACGEDAFLSRRTAAALLGLRALSIKRIEVTVVGTSRRSRAGLIVHATRRAPEPREIRTIGNLRYSSVARTLIDLAASETLSELRRLVTQAARKNLLDVHHLQNELRAHSHCPGIAKLRLALAAYLPRPDSKSNLEIAFDALLEHHPEIPKPLKNITIDGWEIDRYWPDQKVAVELDGRPYHVAVRDIERDRIKDAKLMILGLLPLRITDRRLEHEPRGAIDDLLALLHLR